MTVDVHVYSLHALCTFVFYFCFKNYFSVIFAIGIYLQSALDEFGSIKHIVVTKAPLVQRKE